MARTRASSRYGFTPAPGTNYSVGQEPELARRLNLLGRALKLHITGLSGFRTAAHSVEVGGFPNDPHTRGEASDSPGVEAVPESTLNRFGLTRPFQGTAELDHIQLFGARGGTTTARGTNRQMATGKTYSLGELWVQAGGSKNLAPLMAAIAMAESGGKTDAISPKNTDGTYDYGPWQINSTHTQFDRAKLISDPLYNARAAVAIERSQGLSAWTTYTSGAYRSFLGTASGAIPTFGRTRPGGQPAGQSSTFGSMSAQYDGYLQESTNIGSDSGGLSIPNPLDLFSGPADAIGAVVDFLKWIAWIFHPRNILRVVEFITGATIMLVGVHTMVQVYRDAPSEGAAPRAGRGLREAAGEGLARTPVGRATRAASGRRAGRESARRKTRGREYTKATETARNRELQRQGNRRLRRESRADKRRGEDIPF